MKFTYALLLGGLLAASPAWAVYAPIPEQDQGKDLVFSVRGGVSYDSNIFGAPGGAINSTVWTVAPTITYNASVTDQTFLSAAYGLTLDQFDRRPGTKLLDSHDVLLRAAHAFSKETVLDLNNDFTISRNPESLLTGIASETPQTFATDQSFTHNQFDAHFTTPVTPKFEAEVKARSGYTRYHNGALGRMLDRIENLYGLAGDYAVLPEVKAIAEVRRQDVYYRKEGESKNKYSNYVMTGVDYAVAEKLTLSGRVGAEWRERRGGPSTTAPYAEFSGKYSYAERSFVTAGYAHTFDESSDPEHYFDEKVDRYFVSVEHSVTALIVASASIDYEPAVLDGRPAHFDRFGNPISSSANLNETTNRFGAALSYLPTKNWIISINYDFDRVNSDDPARSVERHRAGLNASYTF